MCPQILYNTELTQQYKLDLYLRAKTIKPMMIFVITAVRKETPRTLAIWLTNIKCNINYVTIPYNSADQRIFY